MIRELTESFEPKKVFHRKEQIKIIDAVFKNFREFGMASNLLIQGVTGSGKTTVISKTINDNQQNGEKDVLFVSGADTKTTFKTLRALFDINCSTSEKLLAEGIQFLRKNPKILIIDEVNKIKDHENLFDSLNTIYRVTQCPIIIITNKRTIIDNMPDDARLTLFFDKIEFPSYNATEIKDIINDRLRTLKNIKIPKMALQKIYAYSARQGSARVALQIIVKCILANNYKEAYIDHVEKSLEREDWKTFINGLTASEKRFLGSLFSISDQKQYFRHSDLTLNLKDLSPSRISQLVTSFEDYGVLVTEYRNLGRRNGRYRVIRFVSSEIRFQLEDVIYPNN
ncbi:MAG: AAA family ATPase [Nanoarchaeota archaeon]|nr:AAA family ATPase [Nanoarchaeota archaeon]